MPVVVKDPCIDASHHEGASAPEGLTAAEFLALCEKDPFLELIRGEVVQVSPVGGVHNQVESETHYRLSVFVRQNNLGVVWGGDAGFILEREPSTVRSPDVSFVSKARIEAVGIPEGFFPGAPDLAVEIQSPNDSLKALEARVRMFLRSGSGVAWILSPSDWSARVYRPGEPVRVLGPDDELDAEPVLPEFRCRVRDLFGSLPARPAKGAEDDATNG